jgi:hypothetical protein
VSKPVGYWAPYGCRHRATTVVALRPRTCSGSPPVRPQQWPNLRVVPRTLTFGPGLARGVFLKSGMATKAVEGVGRLFQEAAGDLLPVDTDIAGTGVGQPDVNGEQVKTGGRLSAGLLGGLSDHRDPPAGGLGRSRTPRSHPALLLHPARSRALCAR